MLTWNNFYLGDGLYASHDGQQLEIYSHDGERKTNAVFLEPDVLQALLDHLKRMGVIG